MLNLPTKKDAEHIFNVVIDCREATLLNNLGGSDEVSGDRQLDAR